MTATIEFFRVANGDMTLVTFDSGRTLLIDCLIRTSADDPDDDTPDVAKQLKDRLKCDPQGRRYVDAMLLSHPDLDHCCGLKLHFHLGPPGDYVAGSGKILIREQWSSPIVFRRTSKSHALCEDAKAWNAEARRRVKRFREKGSGDAGDRIRILGEDVDGKTDDLGLILTKADETITMINGFYDGTFEAFLLAPRPSEDDEDEEEVLTKNNSSVVLRFKLASGHVSDACRFLTGGDAEVAIWERLWKRYKDDAVDKLGYDILLSPHHCSWHSLSWDSWSQCGEDAEASEDARSALAQARDGAAIIASSKKISDNDADPPCVRAKREYKAILKPVVGDFVCLGDDGPEPLAFEIKPGGFALKAARVAAVLSAPSLIGAKPIGHG